MVNQIKDKGRPLQVYSQIVDGFEKRVAWIKETNVSTAETTALTGFEHVIYTKDRLHEFETDDDHCTGVDCET